MSRLTESLKGIKNDPPIPLNLTPEEKIKRHNEIMELHERYKEWIRFLNEHVKF